MKRNFEAEIANPWKRRIDIRLAIMCVRDLEPKIYIDNTLLNTDKYRKYIKNSTHVFGSTVVDSRNNTQLMSDLYNSFCENMNKVSKNTSVGGTEYYIIKDDIIIKNIDKLIASLKEELKGDKTSLEDIQREYKKFDYKNFRDFAGFYEELTKGVALDMYIAQKAIEHILMYTKDLFLAMLLSVYEDKFPHDNSAYKTVSEAVYIIDDYCHNFRRIISEALGAAKMCIEGYEDFQNNKQGKREKLRLDISNFEGLFEYGTKEVIELQPPGTGGRGFAIKQLRFSEVVNYVVNYDLKEWEKIKICELCGKAFIAKRKQERYCSIPGLNDIPCRDLSSETRRKFNLEYAIFDRARNIHNHRKNKYGKRDGDATYGEWYRFADEQRTLLHESKITIDAYENRIAEGYTLDLEDK